MEHALLLIIECVQWLQIKVLNLSICAFSSDVLLLCSTFVFFFRDDIVQQRPVHAICNLIPISSPTPPLSLRVSTTPPNVKTRNTFSEVEQNNTRVTILQKH